MLKVLGGHQPPSALTNQVYHETAGNPFFVEELFRHLVEENRFFDTVGRFRTELNITEGDVPRNVRLVICRRLARLQENTRKVLEVAAVIGRVFEFGLLLRSVEVNSDSAIQSLKEADDAGLISSCSPSAQARFEFSHELIRQTILSELPVPRRQVLHLEVAGAIERLNDSGQHHHAAILAHQLLQAGAAAEPTRTLKSLVAAAESAKEQQAFREAEKDYRHALLILKELPETAERDARELDLLMKVVPLVWTNQGFGGEQLQELNARCRVLAERTGELSSLINDAYASWTTTIATGQYAACEGFADILIEIAKKEGSDLSLSLAYEAQLEVRTYRGDLLGSEEHFASGNALFRLPGFQQITGAVDRVFFQASLNAWLLGFADTACQRFVPSIGTAPQRSSFDHAHAKCNAGALSVLLREPEKAAVFAAQAVEISRVHGYPEIAAWSSAVLGWAKAQLGAAREGVTLLRQYAKFARATGQRIFVTAYLTGLRRRRECVVRSSMLCTRSKWH